MFYKWQSKNVRKAIAVLSIIVSVAVIVFVEGLRHHHKEDQLIINHICLLQILSSIILYIGSRKFNQWLFLPWLLVAAVFTYALIYKSLFFWFHLLIDVKGSLTAILLLYLIAGCWIYFIDAVVSDFRDMQSIEHHGKSVVSLL